MAVAFSMTVERFRKVMGILAVAHLVLLLLVVLTPGGLVYVLNLVPSLVWPDGVAPNAWFEGAAHADHALYTSMSAAYLAIFVLICGLLYSGPERYEPLTPLLLIAKAVGGLYGLAYYLWSHHYFINMLLACVDLPVAIVILVFWLLARPALQKPLGPAA
jgi:hypothetical protein